MEDGCAHEIENLHIPSLNSTVEIAAKKFLLYKLWAEETAT